MKHKTLSLLTLSGALLLGIHNWSSWPVIGQAYFFFSLVLIIFFAGTDLLSPFFNISPKAWGKESSSLLQSWQKLRYPSFIFLILGLSINYDQLHLQHGYFSPTAFLFRQVIFFLLIASIPKISPRPRQVSSLFGLFLGSLLLYSLFFIDWGMHFFAPWHSTMFPLLMGAISVSLVVGLLLFMRARSTEVPRLAIAILFFTLYLHFGQFLIIWQARLPVEMKWYEIRTIGLYGLLCILMLSIKYLLPLVLLFLRDRIQKLFTVRISGILVIIGTLIELTWIYQII